MKERPILMSAPMVQALLAGTKTQTRRVVKPQPPASSNEAFNHGDWSSGTRIDKGAWGFFSGTEMEHVCNAQVTCPYGKPGDRLWVREGATVGSLKNPKTGEETGVRIARYAADGKTICDEHGYCVAPWWFKAKSGAPMFMPRRASRITLEVTDVRVQRLQEISVEDSLAEGITHSTLNDPRVEYRWLWEAINGAGSWEANLWVWCISFRRMTEAS